MKYNSFEVTFNVELEHIEVFALTRDGKKVERKNCGTNWNKQKETIPIEFHESLEDELDLSRRKLLEYRRKKRLIMDLQAVKEIHDFLGRNTVFNGEHELRLTILYYIKKKAWELTEEMFEGFNGANYFHWVTDCNDIEELRNRICIPLDEINNKLKELMIYKLEKEVVC